MRYTIHRGQHEIGGMCIEVAAADGTRILLDLGMPLTAPDGADFPRDTPQRPTADLITEGILRDIPGVFPHDPGAPGVAAIILTHSHLDHYGLAHHAHPAIPVYGSDGTISVLEVGRVFFPTSALPTELRRLPTNEPVIFGALSVTAIPVDHAAPDSRALSSRPMASGFSTQGTCAHMAAPASDSTTCSRTSASTASIGS